MPPSGTWWRRRVSARCAVLTDGKEVALGTIVGADGWILTKASELKGTAVCKLKDGTALEAKVIGIHEQYDLALLKVEAKNLKPVVWGRSEEARPGHWVAAPGNGGNPVAIGVISVAARKVTIRDLPLTNAGYLGVGLEAAEEKDPTKGAKITQVMAKSAAEKAGLKVNDIVIAVGEKTIPDHETMIEIIQRFKPGESVVLKVFRDGKQVELKATLDKRPTDGRSDFQNRLGGSLSERRGGFPMILQHDTILKPNECGGPLVDLDSKTVGINIARAGRVETYAIPAEAILALLPDLKSGKFAPKETISVKTDSDEVKKAREALKKAETELAEAQKKSDEAKKKVDDLKKALDKAETEAKKIEKK